MRLSIDSDVHLIDQEPEPCGQAPQFPGCIVTKMTAWSGIEKDLQRLAHEKSISRSFRYCLHSV
jgi:hypothetical protein